MESHPELCNVRIVHEDPVSATGNACSHQACGSLKSIVQCPVIMRVTLCEMLRIVLNAF